MHSVATAIGKRPPGRGEIRMRTETCSPNWSRGRNRAAPGAWRQQLTGRSLTAFCWRPARNGIHTTPRVPSGLGWLQVCVTFGLTLFDTSGRPIEATGDGLADPLCRLVWQGLQRAWMMVASSIALAITLGMLTRRRALNERGKGACPGVSFVSSLLRMPTVRFSA